MLFTGAGCGAGLFARLVTRVRGITWGLLVIGAVAWVVITAVYLYIAFAQADPETDFAPGIDSIFGFCALVGWSVGVVVAAVINRGRR